MREMPEVGKLWTRVATPADCQNQRDRSGLAVDHGFDLRLARAERSVLRGNLGGVIDQARKAPVACDCLGLVIRAAAVPSATPVAMTGVLGFVNWVGRRR